MFDKKEKITVYKIYSIYFIFIKLSRRATSILLNSVMCPISLITYDDESMNIEHLHNVKQLLQHYDFSRFFIVGLDSTGYCHHD